VRVDVPGRLVYHPGGSAKRRRCPLTSESPGNSPAGRRKWGQGRAFGSPPSLRGVHTSRGRSCLLHLFTPRRAGPGAPPFRGGLRPKPLVLPRSVILLLVKQARCPLSVSRPGRRRGLRPAFCGGDLTAQERVVRLASGEAPPSPCPGGCGSASQCRIPLRPPRGGRGLRQSAWGAAGGRFPPSQLGGGAAGSPRRLAAHGGVGACEWEACSLWRPTRGKVAGLPQQEQHSRTATRTSTIH